MRVLTHKEKKDTNSKTNGNSTVHTELPTNKRADLISKILLLPGTTYKLNRDIGFPLKSTNDAAKDTSVLLGALIESGIVGLGWRGNGGHLSIHFRKFTEFETPDDEQVPKLIFNHI